MSDDGLLRETLESNDSAAASVKQPAIALLTMGCVGALMALLAMFWSPELPADEMTEVRREAIELATGTLQYLVAGLSLIMNGLIAFGALRMLQLRSRGLAILACILGLVNLTCSCLTFPFAVWGLMVLNDETVKRGFERNATPGV